MAREQQLALDLEKVSRQLVESVAMGALAQAEILKRGKQTQADALASAQRSYADSVASQRAELLRIEKRAGLCAAPWTAPEWQSYVPLVDRPIPRWTRGGVVTSEGHWDRLVAPAMFPIIGGKNLLIAATGPALHRANLALQGLTLRLLATLPPGKLRLTMFDPVDRGRNLAGFMHLNDYLETLTGGQVWTEQAHIQSRLEDLTVHMDMVIQKYLRNQYPDIEAYNIEAGEVEEPYRIVLVANFPAGFTTDSANRLISIARSGSACGVYVIATLDSERSLPYGVDLKTVTETSTLLVQNGDAFIWQEQNLDDCRTNLDDPPPAELFDQVVRAVGRAALDTSVVRVPFRAPSQDPAGWWQNSAAKELRVPLGRAGARQEQQLVLGPGTAQHVLIAGKTGSGKSTLLHVLITNLALYYPPSEVRLYLIDFKKGVEFKPYASERLPHARVVAIQSEREFGLSVLQGLDEELQRRGDLFRQAGCSDLPTYRLAGYELPRLVLLVDEFHEFFSEDDALGQQAALILDRLVRQGRAFGVHVILGSQSLAGSYTMARSTVDQMAVRIALQCSDADSRLVLSEDNGAARLLNRPGEGIYNASNGLVEGNVRFQTSWLTDDDQAKYLKQVRLRAGPDAGSPTVFEGTEPAAIERNGDLARALSQGAKGRPRTALAWLGEPIALRERHTAIPLHRQSRANLLIIGQDESAAAGMLAASLLGLAAQHGPRQCRFLIVDMATPDGPAQDALGSVAELLPQPTRIARRRRQVAEVVAEAAELVAERQAQERDEDLGPSVYLVILGLHALQDLRADENAAYRFDLTEDGASPASPARQFAALLRDGPEVGVHVLMWCNTLANAERTLDRHGLAECGLRVALQMGSDASMQLIDSPAASRLGPCRAYLYDEDQVGRLEKFRPYAVLSHSWLAAAGRLLRQTNEETARD